MYKYSKLNINILYFYMFYQVFVQWKNIAYVMRDRIFQDGEELEIDMFDLEVNIEKRQLCVCLYFNNTWPSTNQSARNVPIIIEDVKR